MTAQLDYRAGVIEQLTRLVAAHPVLEHRPMVATRADLGEWHLMGAPGSFDG
jgi:hypothetical protein